MSKVIDEVRHKVSCGQNLFRRSTIEKMLAEYDRLLMRNTALEKNAAEQSVQRTADPADTMNEFAVATKKTVDEIIEERRR
jgi:hypothetical protein